MNGIALLKTGSVDDVAYVETLPTPSLKSGEVLVRIRAAALNRVDQVIIRGYPGLTPAFPHVLGADAAGEVEMVGESVTDWKKGDRVAVYPLIACGSCTLCQEGKPNLCERFQYFGMQRPGTYAELLAVPAANLHRLPESVPYDVAASIGVAGLTAYHALLTDRELIKGRSVMIWGATGGVGVFAIQFAKAMGLNVIATTRRPESESALRKVGADHVFLSDDPKIVDLVKGIAPSGVDHVIDYVGPATFARSFQLLKKGGAITLCGILTGLETTLSIHQTYFRHLRIHGIYLGTHEEFDTVLRLAGDGKLHVPIGERYALKDGQRALAEFATKPHFGKVVLEVE